MQKTEEIEVDINLNADLGESFGAWRMGDDRALLAVIGSANVACGFHAGDPLVMTESVRLAGEAGVSLGAHPAFPDLQGFGRREMQLSPRELSTVVTYQVGALMGIAQSQGQRVTHVKPHGAMSNMACQDAAMAATIAAASGLEIGIASPRTTGRSIGPNVVLIEHDLDIVQWMTGAMPTRAGGTVR